VYAACTIFISFVYTIASVHEYNTSVHTEDF
jgi:hypothetical protein